MKHLWLMTLLVHLPNPLQAQVVYDLEKARNEPPEQIFFIATQFHQTAQGSENPLNRQNAVGLWKLYIEKAEASPNPDHSQLMQGHFRLGAVLLMLDRNQEAQTHFKRVLRDGADQLAPQEQMALAMIGYEANPFEDRENPLKQQENRGLVALLDKILSTADLPGDQRLVLQFARAETCNALNDYPAAAEQYADLGTISLVYRLSATLLRPRGMLMSPLELRLAELQETCLHRGGFCFIQAGNLERAEEMFDQLQLLPASPVVIHHMAFLLGMSYLEFQEFSQAEGYFRKCVEHRRGEHYVPALYRLAECLEQLSLQTEDLKLRQRLLLEGAETAEKVRNDPVIGPEARRLAARLWTEAGSPSRAKELLEEVAPDPEDLPPEDAEIFYQVLSRTAEKHFQKENWQEAIRVYQQVCRRNAPADLREHAEFQLGRCHWELQDWESAYRQFEAFSTGYPTSERNPSAGLLQSLAAIALEKYPESVQAIEAAVRTAREFQMQEFIPPALFRVANELEQRHRGADAERLYRKLLEEPRVSFEMKKESLQGIIRISIRAEDYFKAIELTTQTLEVIQAHTPSDEMEQGKLAVEKDRLRVERGEYAFQNDQPELAVQYLKEAIEKGQTPEWIGTALRSLAICYEQQSEHENALDCWYELATRFPRHRYAPQAERRLEQDLHKRFSQSRN